MRRILFIASIVLGIAVLTIAVLAQEPAPEKPAAVAPLVASSFPDGQIQGVWQPVEVELVQPLAPAANEADDSCELAFTVSFINGGFGGATSLQAESASEAVTDPELSCAWGGPRKGYRTVWYRFAAPINGRVVVDTIGSDYDTILAVSRSDAPSNIDPCTDQTLYLKPVACSDDSQGFTSRVSFDAMKGTIYYIEVADWQADPPPGGGELDISVIIAPLDTKWQHQTPMPLPRSRHAAVAVGDDLYVIGGQSGTLVPAVVERSLEKYETDTNTWVTLAEKPGTGGYANTSAAYIDGPNDDGRIYLPSGYTGNNTTFGGTHWAYDIKGDFWLTRTNATWPTGQPIGWAAAVANPAQNGYYLTGGLASQPAFDPEADVISQTLFYDAANDSWQAGLPDMQSARYAHMAGLVDGKVCVAGGLGTGLVTDPELGPVLATILHRGGECYTPGGSWAPIADMNYPRYAAGSAVVPDGKRWFVFGGIDANGNPVRPTEVYNADTNVWTVFDVTYDLGGGTDWPGRAWPRGGFVGSNLWVMGGNNLPESQALPHVEKLLVTSQDVLLPFVASSLDHAKLADGTFAQARQLQFNQSQYHDFDTQLDFFDVFFFDLSQQKRITAWLTNIPSGNEADIAIYGSNKLLWGKGTNVGNLDEAVTLTLPAGRYYVMVERISGLPQPGRQYQIQVTD